MSIDQTASVLVADPIERMQGLGAKFARFIQHSAGQIDIQILTELRHDRVESQDFGQEKA